MNSASCLKGLEMTLSDLELDEDSERISLSDG
jgi:hypothetical protein